MSKYFPHIEIILSIASMSHRGLQTSLVPERSTAYNCPRLSKSPPSGSGGLQGTRLAEVSLILNYITEAPNQRVAGL